VTNRTAGTERLKLVTFRVADEQFATDIFSIERVLRFAPPRPIPNVPSWLEGVMDYSGRVVPVVDLRARFGLEAAPREQARIMIVTLPVDEWIGVIVDAVDDVTAIAATDLAPPPPIFRGLARDYLHGLVRPQSEGAAVLLVLDFAQLLSTHERIVLEGAVAARAAHA
jgi:purine-binding chemotaxis protein CheW